MTALPEPLRLAELHALGVLDTPADPAHDALARVAAHVAQAPTALVSLVDEHRQWFKARLGLDQQETAREVAFCDAVVRAAAPVVVPDALLDPRFRDNPLVTGPLGIRFYAGFPLVTRGGAVLGSLCVLDTRPRPEGLTDQQEHLLGELAGQVVAQMELARSLRAHAEALEAQRLSERRLAASEQRFRVLFESSTVGQAEADLDGTVLAANAALAELLGVADPAQLVGVRASDLVAPEDRADQERNRERVLAAAGGALEVQRSVTRPDGSTVDLAATVRAVLDEEGVPVQLIATAVDVTARNDAARQLRRLNVELATAHDAARSRAALTQAVLQTVGVGLAACDGGGRLTLFNDAARALLGSGPEAGALPEERAAAYGLHDAAGTRLLLPEELPLVRALHEGPVRGVVLLLRAPGLPDRLVRVDAAPMHDGEGRPRGAVAACTDITRERADVEALRRSEERFRAAFRDGPTPTVRLDAAGHVREANPAMRRLLSLPERVLIGSALSSHLVPEDQPVLQGLRPGDVAELRLLRGGCLPVWCEAVATRTDGEDGPEVLVQLLDVDARKAQEAELERAASQDPLTGLANRSGLLRRLRALVAADGPGAALLYLDLDAFKAVNDVHGHPTGDAVLLEVAARLSASVRAEDLVARLGGDEFVVACPLPVQDLAALAARVEQALAAPVEHGGLLLSVGVSVGTGTADPGSAAEAALSQADAAMYRRKHVRRRALRPVHAAAPPTGRFAEQVATALVQDRLALAYQPVVDTATGALRGVEALLRPVDGHGGPMPLEPFLTTAEQQGSITGIGRWVLQQALTQVAAWKRDLPPGQPFSVGVNVSPLQLHDPALHAHLALALETSGLDPSAVVLEVTEGRLLPGTAPVRTLLEDLRALGVHLAVDDFGTGWASIEYLRSLPFDVVKVDRCHTAALGDGDRPGRLARGVFALARETGLVVVAEGVEAPAQQRAVLDHGCVLSQGHLYARPLRAAQLAEVLAERSVLPRPRRGADGAPGAPRRPARPSCPGG